jgi:hypothetical protein
MKIAIHPFEKGFNETWLPYLKTNTIDFKIVDCYKTDIISQLDGCTHLVWSWTQHDPIAMILAYDLTRSLEKKGIKVFPSSNNSWHFDDKVAQKYLLEAIGAPLVKSYVFYSKKEAVSWVNNTDFPKVFKLKGGAGSNNVKLAVTKTSAKKMINKSFGRGFNRVDRFELFKDRKRKFKHKQSKETIIGLFKGFVRLFVATKFEKVMGREKGYAYFQDFIPNNDSDIRIIIIGKRAFGIKRMVRENDFRASGSGIISYDINDIPKECIEIAFNVSKRLETDCLCYDFVYLDKSPKIVEISYGFSYAAYEKVKGYWNEDLIFIREQKPLANYILDDIINII